MSQNFHSANKMSLKSRYAALCKLYAKYKICIKIILENVPENPLADDMMVVLDKIFKDIEKLPISWEFYNKQNYKFSQEFEDLIIFNNISN